MLLRTVAMTCLLLAASVPAHAGDSAAVPIAEYDNVPPGLLLSPAQRHDMQSPNDGGTKDDSASTTSNVLDPQVLTHSLRVLEDKPEQSGEAKIVSMSQIEQAYSEGKYGEIVRPLEENIAQNDPQATLLMGIMLENGQGMPVNQQRATELYARAAEANLSQAQHRLALQYYQGRGVAKDSLIAMKWLHIAAATYRDGPQKQRAITDRDNLNAALSRKDRETAVFMAREWLTKKGIAHLMEAQAVPADHTQAPQQ